MDFNLTPKRLMGDQPAPHHDTDKRCYQSRHSVSSTIQGSLGFRDSRDNGHLRSLGHYEPVHYTQINDRAPTAPERGIAPDQSMMGCYCNSFERND